MRVREREAKKWVSIMLPEERELSKTTFISDEERPVLSREQLKDFDKKLKRALLGGYEVEITYYIDHSFQTVQSEVRRLDTKQGDLYLVHGNQRKMPLSQIIAIDLKRDKTANSVITYRGAM